MRYEKAETILRLALDMQASLLGVALDDIQRNYSDKPLSRRTAERLRDAVERLFPQVEQANPGEVPKRWRLPGGSINGLASATADELAAMSTAISILRRDNLLPKATAAELLIAKIRALLKPPAIRRIEPDLEALTEAEGLGMRPGPRPRINDEVLTALREAIIARRKVRLHYLYRGSGKRGYETVHPYGFLYGNRHYLIAWSESKHARDFRNYALANIERAEPLNKSFIRKENFSVAKYSESSFGVFHEKPFDVVWRFSAKVANDAKEYLFHPTQTLEPQKDGSLIVRFRAGGLLEMSWHLATWGDQVEVIQPSRLVSLLRENAVIQSRHYAKLGREAGRSTSRRRTHG